MNALIMSFIVNFLQNIKFKISNSHGDGRINSSINEDEILDILININDTDFFKEHNLKLSRGKEREWYDFKVESDMVFIPINLKVSHLTKNSPDNTNCKLGIFYALTGVRPEDISLTQQVSWSRYFKELNDNLDMTTSTEYDYYFLIVNKDDLNDVFYTSLKGLKETKANANNLPFQVVWNNNREVSRRSLGDSNLFILNSFKASIDNMKVKSEFDAFYNKAEVNVDSMIKQLKSKYPSIDFYIENNNNNILVYHNSLKNSTNIDFITSVSMAIGKLIDKKVVVIYDVLMEYIK